jgi:hypothetical protein
MAAVPVPPPAPTLSTAAQALVTTFNASLTPDQRTNFANTLQNSPALINQINTAVASGELRGFSLLAPGTNAGGQFNPTSGTLELPAAIMSTPAQPRGARFNPAELTYVVGHETQHAIYHPTVATALTAFDTEIWRIAQTRQPIHDYTAPLNTMLTVNRNDESAAHIAGFNATVSMVRSSNAHPSLEDIYRASPARMGEFINVTPGTPATYALRAGYAVNADMTMTANATNMAAAGRHYFDQPAASARLGHNGDSNYQNNYAANLVSGVVNSERFYAPGLAAAGVAPTPQIAINMTSLGLNEAQLERNGLNFGAAAGRQPYLNTGTTPPTAGNFDHTILTHTHVPVTMPPPAVPAPAVPAPTEQQIHPAVRQAMDAIGRSSTIPAGMFGPSLEPAAAGLALHAANQQITLNHAVLSDRGTDLLAVQGPLGDPGARVSTPLPVADAVKTDVPVAQQKLDALQSAQPQIDLLAPKLSAQQQDNPTQEAPSRPPR